MRLITTSRAETLTIGRLSELTCVNIETIRYGERTKVLTEPRRSGSGRRLYQAADVRTLAFLRRARELGFSLTEIRTLLRLGGPEKASCRDVRRVAAHHLEDIRSKISDLRKLERLLANTYPDARERRRRIVPCSTFSTCDTPNSGRAYRPRSLGSLISHVGLCG